MDTEYNAKVTRVLKKLLEPDFKVKNDVYLNSLLVHLTGDPENGSNTNWDVLNKQHIPAWLMEAVTQWEKQGKPPTPKVLSFALNLASCVCKDEQTFVMLNSQNIYERLIKFIHPDEQSTAPTIKLGYIRLVSSFLEHKSGLQWIISTNFWADVMCLSLKNQTIYITKEGYTFLARLLEKSIKINEIFFYNVVQLIMAPLSKDPLCLDQNKLTNVIEVKDQVIHQSLSTSLNLITEILEIFLKNINKENDVRIVVMFNEKFSLERNIRNLLLIAQNEDFIYDLYKILFLISIFDLYLKFGGKGGYIEYDKASAQAVKLFDIFTDNVSKGFVHNVVRLTYVGNIYWRNISNKMPICVRSNNNPFPYLFENQMLMLQLYPIISVSLKLLGEKAEQQLDDDEVRDNYVDKICKNSTPVVMRIFFKWRNFLMYNSYLFSHATLGLNYLLKSRQFFTRDLATTAFQTLIYCLRDIIAVLKDQSDKVMILSKEFNYMALLLDVIIVFINEFNFNWRDSLESICTTNMSVEFLSISTWPSKLVVKGLKLVDVSISKYMSPSMALLMDSAADSTMALIGPMLYAKLHDGSWEVRDSAMEVLCTIAHNANEKFPFFQKLLLDADLPSLVLTMSTNDGEAFVRATAIKCLQEMVQVQEFWSRLLNCGNIHEQIIEILQKETEGIVRSEAAILIAKIYEFQDIPAAILSKFYDIMTHAATADLHWEVKVNALQFWNKLINRHLMHQGMIDGTFPKVTFSKEHRKIMTLNEPEVRKRLIKVLNQLSETGCLSVLITALQDDCDIEVSKTAMKITKDFVKLLKTYNVEALDANLSTPPSPLTPYSAVPSPPYSTRLPASNDSQYQSMSPLSQLSQNSVGNGQMDDLDMTDAILDDIINAQDLNLLRGVFNAADRPSTNSMQMRFRQVVTPNDFLKFTYSDLESHTEERTKWMNGMDDFGSLLDDILKDYDSGDINNMDCY